MIDGMPNRPLYFYPKDIIESQVKTFEVGWNHQVGCLFFGL